MNPWLIGGVAAAAAGALALASGSASAAPSVPVSKGRAIVVAIAEQAGLSEFWTNWLVWVSKGESGWSTGAHNDSPGESLASANTMTRLIKEGRWPCPNAPGVFAIGSGGLYGQLAPLTTYFLNKNGLPELACAPAIAWRNVPASTLGHLAQTRGTLKMIPAGYRNALVLRAAYGNPGRLEHPAEIDNPKRRSDYGDTLDKAGIGRAFLDVAIPVGSIAMLDQAIATLRGLA